MGRAGAAYGARVENNLKLDHLIVHKMRLNFVDLPHHPSQQSQGSLSKVIKNRNQENYKHADSRTRCVPKHGNFKPSGIWKQHSTVNNYAITSLKKLHTATHGTRPQNAELPFS